MKNMAIHMNDVSNEAKTILSDVRSIGKRVLERFYEGFGVACKDVHKGWRHLKPRERKIVFEKVQDVAKDLIVDKQDGGGANDGLALGTFYGYVCKVKRAMIYHVPLSIAERATNQELQKAQVHVRDVLKDSDGTVEEKMIKAYQWVKSEQVKEKERLKSEAEKNVSKVAASIETAFTLPDPDDYESGDEDSDALLQGGIHSILAWLQTRSLKLHLDKEIKSAKVLRRVLGELTAYDNSPVKKKQGKMVSFVA